MATFENLQLRVQRLVSSGLIYHGQPDKHIEYVLARKSREWVVTHPNCACNPPCGRRPWGDGMNESMRDMLSCARIALYGFDVSSTDVERFGRDVVDRARAIHLFCKRADGSLYCVPHQQLCGYLLACHRAGIAPIAVGTDARDYCERVTDFDQLVNAGLSAALSIELAAEFADWFRRYCHRNAVQADRFAVMTYLGRHGPKRKWRSIATAYAFTRDWVAAEALAGQFRTLRSLIERIELAKALAGEPHCYKT